MSVTGMDQNGTVLFTCPTGTFTDAAGNPNTVSASPASATVNFNYLAQLTLTLGSPSISEAGTTTGTITLPDSVVVPAGGLAVYLTSSDTREATVPASVLITGGGPPTVSFTITGVQDGVVDGTNRA